MRERGFRVAWRFYRAHFGPVFVLSFLFYLVIAALAALSVVELGVFSIFTIYYLIVASIFWLQAPLARLMDDVRAGRPHPGARRTLTELGPRLGAITGGTFIATMAVSFASYLLILPGLILAARWALLIPVIVIEGRGAWRAFGRSNQLVRRHTARVVVELLVSAILFVVVWAFAIAVLTSGLTVWAALPLACAMLAVGTPVIPLMRVLSYYDLLAVAPADS